MLRMKLPMRTAEEGADRDRLDKETVFEWFGLHLSPAERLELMCGLLHMCQPLELRFLGSCLEDLARKDYHVLRDFELKANSPGELGLLLDVAEPVVRSKLLVCLSLLASDSREAAAALFRILSHAEPALCFPKCGFPCGDGRRHLAVEEEEEEGRCEGEEPVRPAQPEAGPAVLEQLALLFTMAALHPAFPFHQREAVRVQLQKVQAALVAHRRHQQHAKGPNKPPKTDYLNDSRNDRAQSRHSNQSPARKAQREAVYIEKIVLKGISKTRMYSFEVKWSDSSSSSVTKTHHELENFLLKLPKELSTETFEKGILRLLNQGEKNESRDLERTLKEKFSSAPQAFRQIRKVCGFFSDSSSPGCSRGNPGPPGKPFTEDCSEASSQEEDMEPYIVGHRKKPGSKSPSLSAQRIKGSQAESRRAPPTEHNGIPEWRRKSCSVKPVLEPAVPGPEQCHGDERWSTAPGSKGKPRVATTDRDKGKVGESRVGYVANGLPRSALGPVAKASTGHHHDTGSGQDSYGETSSESYSSPSSPQHDGQESLESEDEKDKDTDSHSDDYCKRKQDSFPACQAGGGSAAGTVHPLVPLSLKDDPSRTESPLSVPFSQLPFVHPVPYLVQNGAGTSETGDSKGGVMMALPVVMHDAPAATQAPTAGETEPPTADLTPLAPPTFVPAPLPQPIIQRFKTAPLQPGPESPTPINVVPPGPAYLSNLQPVVPTHTPGPAPTPSPALTHSTAQSDSTAYINSSSSSSSTAGCGACGCRGVCGSNHAPNYFFPPQMPRQVMGMHPFLHLSNGAAQLPFFTPYGSGPMLHTPSEHVLGSQVGYGMQQMAAFSRFYQPVFHSLGLMPGALGGGAKKNGVNVSCYNCGGSGHYAQDCKQPSIDATQQGGFRLKYIAPPSSEAPDKAD